MTDFGNLAKKNFIIVIILLLLSLFILYMIVNKIAGSKLLHFNRITMKFGGVVQKKYDWREDHSANSDYQQDPRMVGVKPASQYSFPHKAAPLQWQLSHPDNYNQKDLSVNMVGLHQAEGFSNLMEAPSTDFIPDIAHEFDYESQDCDFQAESFQSQHFRKKGYLWMWGLVSMIPFWFTYVEFFYQEWPDDDNWRYQRPPPLNYPDDMETPDTQLYELFKTKTYKDLHEAGKVRAPFFEIKDGKKVYTKWAGVNQPIEPF